MVNSFERFKMIFKYGISKKSVFKFKYRLSIKKNIKFKLKKFLKLKLTSLKKDFFFFTNNN